MNTKNFSRIVLSTAISIGLLPQAFAMPHHRMIHSEQATSSGACTYPDGTAPKNRPEIHCYEPKEFLKAYGIDKLHKMGLTGRGQTIILVDSFGSPTMQADLDHFSETFGLPKTKIEFIYPNGPYVNPVNDDDHAGWAGETTLDLEWAHAIAPDATLVNIVSNVSETTGLTGLPELFLGIQMAVKQYPGAVVSMSFGTGEPTFTASDIKNYLQGTFHDILKKATAADMTLLASAGDQGSTNINTDQSSLIGFANASYPATDPLITAVGGTALEYGWEWTPQGTAEDFFTCEITKNPNCPTDFLASQSSNRRTETVWKEDWAFAAGGGGVSTIFDAPDYQSGLQPSILKIVNGHRGIPDTSLNAAINGGVDIYTSYVSPSEKIAGPHWQSTGGTSCASPETAALVALAGQRASEELGRNVGIGFLNPILYSLDERDFNDIVSHALGAESQVPIDTNALFFSADVLAAEGPKSVPPVPVSGYSTGRGYDLATGRGSPRAVEFVLDVAQARVERDAKDRIRLP